MPQLEFRCLLPGVSQKSIWEFHRDPAVLTKLTPPDKNVTVVGAPAAMGENAIITLRFRQFGLPITWVSRIVEWDPPSGFVDVQLSGPFRRWRHQHLFEDGQLLDRLDYEVPLAMLGGRLAERLMVRPELERLFAFRQAVTRQVLLGT
ncbi:MAG: SRPBCC family protein [Thermoanaerobaculia bacterium]